MRRCHQDDLPAAPLPRYLSLAEMVRKEHKKYTANGTYKQTEDMADAMDEMIWTGTVMLPPTPGYALDVVERGMAAAV